VAYVPFVAKFLILFSGLRRLFGALLFPNDSPTNRQMKIACAYAFIPLK
jgi:hypothetical protein